MLKLCNRCIVHHLSGTFIKGNMPTIDRPYPVSFNEAGHRDRSTAYVSAASIGLQNFPHRYIEMWEPFHLCTQTPNSYHPRRQQTLKSAISKYLPPLPNAMPLFLSQPLLRRFFFFSSPFSPPRRLHLAALSSSPASMPSGDSGDGIAKKGRLRGLVFDMDGTLTVPVIDFGAMYKAVLGEEGYAAYRAASASGGGVDILHHIEAWPPPAQQRAYEIIARFERQGLDRLQIMPGSSRTIILFLTTVWSFDWLEIGVRSIMILLRRFPWLLFDGYQTSECSLPSYLGSCVASCGSLM